MNMDKRIEMLLNVEPKEPRGWFRWLHSHYLGRYRECYAGLLHGEFFTDEWKGISDKPVPLYRQVHNTDQLITFLNRHAWMAAFISVVDTVYVLWDHLEKPARGAFLAGLSEVYLSSETCDQILSRLSSAELSTESWLQIATNAIACNRIDLLKALLQHDYDPDATIKRYDPFSPEEREYLAQVSHRTIDMILEAALVKRNRAAAELALQHGANHNTPIWQYERSYNETHTPLSYTISAGDREMAELLMQYGASPLGTEYGGENFELFEAISRRWDDMADRLISLGASLSVHTTTERKPLSGRNHGSESDVIRLDALFWGHRLETLEWAQNRIGSIIPLVPIREKHVFNRSSCQGWEYNTMLSLIIGSPERLKHFESLGLDTRLTAEELLTAINDNAYGSLFYLLSKYGDEARDQVLSAIREHKPEFGKA